MTRVLLCACAWTSIAWALKLEVVPAPVVEVCSGDAQPATGAWRPIPSTEPWSRSDLPVPTVRRWTTGAESTIAVRGDVNATDVRLVYTWQQPADGEMEDADAQLQGPAHAATTSHTPSAAARYVPLPAPAPAPVPATRTGNGGWWSALMGWVGGRGCV